MSVVIREADIASDMGIILPGAKDFISRMDHIDYVPETDEELNEALLRMFSLPGIKILLAELDGNLVGSVGFIFGPHPWNTKLMVADELFLWCSPDAPKTTVLRLLRASEALATEMSADIIQFSKLGSSPDSIEKVYSRMGMKEINRLYMKVL